MNHFSLTANCKSLLSLYFYIALCNFEVLPLNLALAKFYRNEIPANFTVSQHEQKKVKLGFKIIPYKINTRPKQSSKFVVASESILKFTLKASVNKTNHFYFHGFHIEANPKKWDRNLNNYTTRLHIFKTFGENSELEEKMGDLTVKGKIKSNKNNHVLHGISSKVLKNKFGEPIMKVVAGFKPSQRFSKISKKS